MIVECGNCCAPLDADGKSAFVKCSYCECELEVRGAELVDGAR
ncbi:MAG: hypothetical protein M5U28_02280 [Sandaracinaceae bacterium]|nr:hypothetical protein [Sandaracinaceae bacterium]